MPDTLTPSWCRHGRRDRGAGSGYTSSRPIVRTLIRLNDYGAWRTSTSPTTGATRSSLISALRFWRFCARRCRETGTSIVMPYQTTSASSVDDIDAVGGGLCCDLGGLAGE